MTHYHILKTEERTVTLEVIDRGTWLNVNVSANKIGNTGEFKDAAAIYTFFRAAILQYADNPKVFVSDPANVLIG